MSIVVPSFNQARFLRKALDSIVSQSVFLNSVEVIIVDPGSSDGSLDIINDYTGNYSSITAIIGKDSGQVNAINLGISKATGDYVGWLNSDDEFLSEHLFRVMDLFDRTPEVEFVYSNGYLIDEFSNIITEIKSPSVNYLLLCFIDRNFFIQPGVFWRRSLNHRIGLLDESFNCVFDNEWYLRVFRNSSAARITEFGACLRIHSDTKSNKLQEIFAEENYRLNLKYGKTVPLVSRVLSKMFRLFAKINL